ncbi:MAG: FeS cluster assembly protein SufD [Chlamydiia bacterium]|nr:FeS cluster assembly protein SufD [Chlamydiia bacterium]MCH9616216.1 FeS cluster assembly protein SufD [Chlamydiia bacterium]MCH9629798.1 FeS cluster assembly protein SufD [Chlamydiia bacterium]
MLELLEKRKKKPTAWKAFLEKGLPTRKQETFKYVSLSFDASENETANLTLNPTAFNRPEGTFTQNRERHLLASEKNPFALLCLAAPTKTQNIYIPTTPDQPLTLNLDLDGTTFTTIHLCLAKNVELTLITHTNATGFHSTLLDITVEDNAKLTHIHHPNATGSLFENIRTTLKRDATYSYIAKTKGAKTHFQDIAVKLAGENSQADVKGLFDLENSHAHANLLMEHIAPHTLSNQHFKTVLNHKAKASFEGKIYIHQDAQKTLAYQLVNHLHLDDQTKSYSKPNLEIFADDVKASHGATTGKLDPDELFYLRARGMTKEQAEHYLIEGYKREILGEIACLMSDA